MPLLHEFQVLVTKPKDAYSVMGEGIMSIPMVKIEKQFGIPCGLHEQLHRSYPPELRHGTQHLDKIRRLVRQPSEGLR